VQVEVQVRNERSEDIWMVGVVDGSEGGLRYPRWQPAVRRDGAIVATPAPPEDPLVGPLRAEDFRRLAPGEAFDPTSREGGRAYLPLVTFASFAPPEPGAYSYTLELSTESEQPDEWLGRWGQDAEREQVLELIERVPRLTLRSNVLEVHVA
jgi:hypothetical protein